MRSKCPSTVLVRKAAEMPTRSRRQHRDAADHPVLEAIHADGPGMYLTDEVFLYRLVGSRTRGMTEMVEIEDCYWLDVVEVSIIAFRERRLRIVTPATGDV